MAGAGLVTIKRRIKSITSIRKITKAMGLVATAKLRRSRENLTRNENFYSECKGILQEVFENYSRENVYNSGNGSNINLYIIFTSDMGLCGSFNSNMVGKALEMLRLETLNPRIMIIGSRGKAYLKKLGYDISDGIVEVPDNPSFSEAENVAEGILKGFAEGEIGQVFAVFTHFISGVKQFVEFQRLLPLPYKYDDCSKEIAAFEPTIDSVAEEAVRLYMTEQLLYCTLNSKASEHSARMNAMNSATRNADELLDKLKLKYNRVRQGMITQEISEIVGGAEALR
ncbi:MAG: ATP synthase F1 subunit gamma [Bacillota bacterium]|nr:ATP synthase F1 subunit gamma [Bacillota bacterium]